MAERLLSKTCDSVVCISEHEANSGLAIGISNSKLELVKNGVSLMAPISFSTVIWPDKRLRLLFVGRLDHQKGYDLILEALRELRDVAFAIIVGEFVVDVPSIANLPDNVSIVGWKSRVELVDYYKGAEILVMPSRWEGFGLTAVEAMRNNLPVFASAVGGLREIVAHGETGILFPPNSSQAIVDAVRSVDRNLLRRMGQSGRRRFEDYFTAERMATEVDFLYHRLVAGQ